MKILITSFAYYPVRSGVPIVSTYLAEGLVKLGHNVVVATRLNGEKFQPREIINGVDIHRFNFGQDLFKRNTGEFEKYIDFVINEPKDVLLMEFLQSQPSTLLMPFLDRINCIKIVHSHGSQGLYMRPFEWKGDFLHTIGNVHNWYRWKKFYKWDILKYRRNIDAALCLSVGCTDFKYYNETFKNTYILENAADPIFFDETGYYNKDIDVCSLLGIKHKKYLVYIANYDDNKNQLGLIDSVCKINSKDISVVFIGGNEDNYYSKVKEKIEKCNKMLGTDIVALTNVERSLFPFILHNAYLFVMSSKTEEYPVTLLETMAVGTPFISTNVGNVRVLPGGITVRDINEMPFFLNYLLNNPDERERLSIAGKEYTREHNTKEIACKQLETIIYESISCNTCL